MANSAVILLIVLSLIVIPSVSLAAWNDPHVLKITGFAQPTGPDQIISADLVLSPADVDVFSYNVRIGYDNTRLTRLQVSNNTTEPTTRFTVGPEEADHNSSYANVVCTIILEGDFDVTPPPAGPYYLGHITIKSRPDYNSSAGPVGLYLRGWPRVADSGIYAGNSHGGARLINLSYESAPPTAAVADWNLY